MLLSSRELLQATIELYRREFWLFLGYAAWLVVPAAVFYFAMALPQNPVTAVLIVVTVVLQLFVWLWITVCLMRATAALSMNQSVDPHVLSTQSLRRVQPLLAVWFLQSLIFIAGFLLLVLPAIIFWVWYGMAQMVTGIDERRPVEALTLSRALVRGRFLSALWRLIAGPVVITLLYGFVLAAILYAIAIPLGIDTTLLFSENPPLWESLMDTVVSMFVMPLYIIYLTLLYLDLKKNPLEKAAPVA